MNIQTRYASAVVSKSLVADPRTSMSDTDVLHAYGLASKSVPLSVALARLLSGDNREVSVVVAILEGMIWKKSRSMKVKTGDTTARDIATACLAWWRDGRCTACGGHGKVKIKGTNTLSNLDCKVCKGTGKIAFEKHFPIELRELAKWAQAEIETNVSVAGPIAMNKIAARMDF